MSQLSRWHWFFGAVLLIAVLAALFGRTEDQDAADQDAGALTWNSSKMSALEKEWKLLWDSYEKGPGGVPANDSKIRYGNTVMSVERLFRKRLSKHDLRQLAATSEMVPIQVDEHSRFTNDLLAFMVKAFVKLGDRASLVYLLSKRCPDRIYIFENIEYFLAHRGTRLKDPILILGEAYSQCQVPETRHTLAAALRRSFAGHGVPGNDDAEFVSNAMRWYNKEKGRLTVNQNYYRNESVGLLPIESCESHPEFYDNPPKGAELLFRVKPVSE